MAAEVETMNVYQKLERVRKHVETIQDDKKGYGYTYTSIESILPQITAMMDRYHLTLIPAITPGTLTVTPHSYKKVKTDRQGRTTEELVNEFLVQADMTFTWLNNDEPDDNFVVPWALVGEQTNASFSTGAALTYAQRYFLLKFFQIATTDDDVDQLVSKQREAEDKENASIASKIVEQLDEKVRAYLAVHPDKKEEVKSFMLKYVKSGNYNTIKQPAVAGKLLRDFNKTFLKIEDKE